MPFEDEIVNLDEITEARRAAVAATIRTISLEELKALASNSSRMPVSVGGKVSPFSTKTRRHLITRPRTRSAILSATHRQGYWFLPKKAWAR